MLREGNGRIMNKQRLMEQLTPEKRAALMALLEKKRIKQDNKAEDDEGKINIQPRNPGETPFHLSFVQHGLWLNDQIDPQNLGYNFPFGLRFKGKLDRELLKRALNEIVKRHEALRTCIWQVDGEPKQIVLSDLALNIETIDLSDYNSTEREEKASIIARKESVTLFDLQAPPLIRCKLILMGPEDTILVVTVHHIVFDQWSMSIFLNELFQIYEAWSKNRDYALPSLEVQYPDYAHWLRERVHSGTLDKQINYWKGQLGDSLTPVEIPPDKPRPNILTSNGDVIFFELTRDESDALRSFVRSHGCTMYMAALAAFMFLIYKYTRPPRIIVGSPMANRNIPELENVIGYFVNTIVLSTELQDGMTFEELIATVKKTVLDAFENQDIPFERIVDELNIQRDPSRSPVFQMMFNYVNVPKTILRLEGLMVQEYGLGGRAAAYELLLSITEEGDLVKGHIEYNTDLYSPSTIERIIGHYKEALQQMVSHSTERIIDIPLVTEQEKDLILYDFNATHADYPKEETVIQLFEKQVERTPHQIALVYEKERLSYAQLNQRANALAARLKKAGIGPNDFVAIVAERSLEMVAGIFGILKAGAAYVPIDPQNPAERTAYILNDLKPKLVLTYQVNVNTNLPVMDLAHADVWEGAYENPEPVNQPNDLMYVIYTSGTTGRPKGVMVEHSGVVNVCCWFARKYAIDSNTRMVQMTNYVFDPFVEQLFTSTLHGATLYIVNESLRTDPHLLREYLTEHKIHVADLPHGISNEIANFEAVKSIRAVISGGEKLNTELSNKIIKAGYALYNHYGPTETTVDALAYECHLAEGYVNIPIGKPIQNTQVYILQGTSLCGIGVPGELCIAGVGLARGYLNNPELTAQKFIKNPFGEGRLYRTGDLARWLPDGNIEFLGRVDDQVKIRGYRIELGEVESALRRIDGIQDAAVIVREDKTGEPSIHAYLVSHESLSLSTVKEQLYQSIPVYMVPRYMMQIASIPVTRNGKLDRKALPEITVQAHEQYIAPRSKEEQTVASVFSDIFGIQEVSITDNFFELGGHSLLAAKLVNALEAETGLRLTLKHIFSCPTVEGLASLLESNEMHKPIPPAQVREWYPMSSTQKRTFLMNQLESHGTTYNMPQAFRVKGELDADRLKEALKSMIQRHEILRTGFSVMGETLIQRIHDAMEPDFAVLEDPGIPDEKIIERFVKPFDLGNPPLIRMQAIKREEEWLLLLDMHHIISDGISNTIFMDELTALYNAQTLKPLRLQYKDYSEWMRTRDISHQKSFWINEFKESVPVLELPYDYKRPKERSFKGASVHAELPGEVTSRLKALTRKTQTTEFMILLSVYMVFLSKYSRQNDIVVGTPISGRTHKDTEEMLGMFVNTLALRGKPDGSKKFSEFLQEMKEKVLKAFECQDYPFEELVEAIGLKRDMSRNPLFDTLFVFQSSGDSALNFAGAKLESVGAHNPIAKFDMTLSIHAYGDAYTMGLEYCTALFRQDTAKRMLEHYKTLLIKVLENPDARIGDISLLNESEWHQLMVDFNQTHAKEAYAESAVHHLFEKQVKKNSNGAAVYFEGQCYTYDTLNRKANQLAHYLIGKGLKPEQGVGLYMDRSLELLVGILGTLKAGCAYVPIDAAWPQERVRDVLIESGVTMVLVHHQTENLVPQVSHIEVFNLSKEEDVLRTYPDSNPEVKVEKENLMYILFTSGTTGRPKGVMVEHRQYLNYLQGIIRRLDIQGPMSFAIVTTFAADLGSTNVYVPLTTGGQVHILSYERASDPEKFAEYFRSYSIDAMKLVPSHFEALQALPDASIVIPNKLIIFAGEALTYETVKKVKRLKPQCAVYNNYGPTETTVSTLCYRVDDEALDDSKGVVPLGRPLDNVITYVLDESRQPVPIGVLGELYIGGPCVSRGYLNNPQQTRERFIDDPFDKDNPYKLYRTGDLVKYLPDGNIFIAGRVDRQIKIRGYRIEPEGIEEVILHFKGIRSSVVTTKNDRQGDKRLVAYLVRDCDSTIDYDALRRYLRSRLPDYMVPAVFVEIEAIPLNANGKIDLGRLPEINEVQSLSDRTYVPPRNALEQRLADIWSEVLGVNKVGIDDNFYDLGGESFKSIKAVKRMDSTLNVIDLIRHPTIREMAELLSQKDREKSKDILYELTRPTHESAKVNFICIPYGGGNAITYKPLADVLPEGYKLYAVQVPGHDYLSANKELKPLDEVAQICLEEIKTKVRGPIAIYGQCVGGALAIKLAQLLEEEKIEIIGVFQAANFPDSRLPGKLFALINKLFPEERFLSDKVYKEMLKSIGGGDETLNKEEQAFMLKGMRHDSKASLDFFTEAANAKEGPQKLKAPICCIIGEKDRTTEFYAERYLEWELFSDQVNLKVIEGGGHFFHKHQTRELKDILVGQVREWARQKEQRHNEAKIVQIKSADKISQPAKRVKPSLKLLWIVAFGQIVSILGSTLSGFAMGIWVYHQSGNVADYATISLFAMIPGILLAPLAGLVADRYDRRKVMIFSDMIAAAGTLLIAAMLFMGEVKVVHIYIATTLGSIAGSFQRPAFMAAVPQIVPKRYLGHANGFLQLGLSAGSLIAPALGGALVVVLGLPGIVMIDFITFLISILTLSFVAFPNALHRKQEESFKKEILGGWNYIIKRKSMIALVVFFIFDNFLASFASILITPLLLSFLDAGKIGIIVAAQSAGLLLGSLIMSLWGGTQRRAEGMIGFVMLSGISLFLFGLRPSAILTTLALFGVGLAVAFINTHWQIIIQTKVGYELQGRVFSINQMLASILAPFSALAGTLADNVFEPMLKEGGLLYDSLGRLVGTGAGRGMGLMFIIIGAIEFIWGFIGLKYKPLRYMEDILPDAVPPAIIDKDKDKIQELYDRQLEQMKKQRTG